MATDPSSTPRPSDAPSPSPPDRARRLPAHTRGLLGIGAAIILAYMALRWLAPVVLAIALGAAIYHVCAPVVAYGERRRIPRSASAAGVYLAAVGIIGAAGAWFGPRLHSQLTSLIDGIPEYGTRLRAWIADTPIAERLGQERFDELTGMVINRADELAGRVVGAGVEWAMSAVGFAFTGLIGLTLGFYLLVSGPKLAQAAPGWIPPAHRDAFVRFGRRASAAVAGYLRSRLIASALIGVAYSAAFWVVGVDHALILGVIGGVMNMFPIIGPFIAAVPAMAVASLQGLGAVVAVVIIMVVAQQVEGHVISPLLDGRMVSLSPTIVLVAVAVGAALFGFVGVLLATPMAAILVAALEVFYRERLPEPADTSGPPSDEPTAAGAAPST